MERRTCFLLMTSSFFVLYVTTAVSAMPTNRCLLQCMRDVFKCKRNENVGIVTETECCDKYSQCYFSCEPDADTAPPCSAGPGKRGSWNKRLSYPAAWNGPALNAGFDDAMENALYGQYY